MAFLCAEFTDAENIQEYDFKEILKAVYPHQIRSHVAGGLP